MQTAADIGAKIARARKLKNLTQTELAGQMSVTSQAVGKWERGESMPDLITFGKLAHVLGIDFNYFGEGFPTVQPDIPSEVTSEEAPEEKVADEENVRNMSSGVWKDADFSGLNGLGSRFSSSNILNCKFINSNLSDLTLNSNNLKNNDFSGSDFSGSKINSSNIEECRFVDCNFGDVEIKASRFSNTTLDGADFTGALFKNSSFSKSTFASAKWHRTRFQHTIVSNMVFDGEMTDCSFEWITRTSGTVFRGVTFRNCFFKHCNFKKARFENCRADRLSLAFLKNSKADVSGMEVLE